MSYQVFIDGAKVPGNVNLVAGAIGERYGLPADALAARMSQGRFRVKKDVDLQTAQQFAADLESLGAIACIADADGTIIGGAADQELQLMPESPAMSAVMPAQPKPASDSPFAGITAERKAAAPDSPFAGITAERKAAAPDSPFAGITAERKAAKEETGLAAALASGGKQDLGALGALGSQGALSVSSLDGDVDEPARTNVGPSKAVPVEDVAAFLPPGALAEAKIEIDAVLPEKPPPITAPEEVQPDPNEVLAGSDAGLGEARAARQSPLVGLWRALNDDTRKRFAVGVLLVTLLGIVPMHLYATMQENDHYSKMKADLVKIQRLVEDVEEWKNLEPLRKATAERMDRKRVNIAITGFVIWLVASGGLGFLYFRKLPWDEFGPRLAKGQEPTLPPAEPGA